MSIQEVFFYWNESNEVKERHESNESNELVIKQNVIGSYFKFKSIVKVLLVSSEEKMQCWFVYKRIKVAMNITGGGWAKFG